MTAPTTCEDIMLRLVDDPDDPALAVHVRSCICCFRTASDLREVPRIAGLLGDAPEGPGSLGADPLLWDRFPASLGRAFDRRGSRVDGALTASWARVRNALRSPLPAALAGAAAAGLLTVSLMAGDRAGHSKAPVDRPETPATTALATVEVGTLVGDDDLWDALDLPEMRQAMAVIAADGDGAGDELDASPLEQVELLEGDDLRLVAAAFEARPPF